MAVVADGTGVNGRRHGGCEAAHEEIKLKLRRVPFVLQVYRFLASLAFLIGSPVWLVGLAARPERWRNRIGLLSGVPNKRSKVKRRVWVHASSVGEVKATTRLVREMCSTSGVEIVFSTMTAAGYSVAKGELTGPTYFFYLPLDVPFIQRRVLGRLDPDVLLLVETELWPSLILEAKKKGTGIAVVNGKISAKVFERYRAFGCLFKPVLSLLDAVVVQSEAQGRNYKELGVPAERITIGGNTKQDSQILVSEKIGLREKNGWSPSEIVLVAGSTRPEEERTICEGFVCARASLGTLRLVLAPRHLRRSGSVAKLASSFGLEVARWSELRARSCAGESSYVGQVGSKRTDVLVLDTMGDLAAAYQEGDVAFVGGTLSGHGGHNILEPAAAGLPIIAGPSRESIEDDSNSLAEAGGLLTVKNASDVAEVLLALAGSSEERLRRGKEASKFYSSRPVASLITLGCLQKAGLL